MKYIKRKEKLWQSSIMIYFIISITESETCHNIPPLKHNKGGNEKQVRTQVGSKIIITKL